MSRYESMRKRIEKLEKERIRHFVEFTPVTFHGGGSFIGIREDKIKEFFNDEREE